MGGKCFAIDGVSTSMSYVRDVTLPVVWGVPRPPSSNNFSTCIDYKFHIQNPYIQCKEFYSEHKSDRIKHDWTKKYVSSWDFELCAKGKLQTNRKHAGFSMQPGTAENRWGSWTRRGNLERRITDAWEMFSECFMLMILKSVLHGSKQSL